MAFGGSFVSWSVTCEPRMVRLQPSPVAKSVVGSSVNVVGPPVTATGCAPLVSHASPNPPSATSTGSLNVTVRFESTATSAALSAGVVDVTVGASSGGAAVVNPTTTSLAMASGGSFVSWSVTCDATIVRVQSSLPAKSVRGIEGEGRSGRH